MNYQDNTAYFWEKIDEIKEENYIPTEQDILLVRYRTTGLIQEKFEINNKIFNMVDVGGTKSERKKWIHCYENVTAIIYVASLSCFDEGMFEDEETNQMMDQLELFDKICNDERFKQSAIILCLNKTDLFREKLKQNIPITLCPEFKDYDGFTTYNDSIKYIKQSFLDKNKTPNKPIFIHSLCGTKQNEVENVFNKIRDNINQYKSNGNQMSQNLDRFDHRTYFSLNFSVLLSFLCLFVYTQ